MTTLRAKTPSARSRASKSRSKQDERDIARFLGGQRHLADTGGPEDVKHEWLAIQVKGGKTVITQAIRDGMASAKLAATGRNVLPVVAVVDRRGTRLDRYLVFDLHQFCAWYGLGPENERDSFQRPGDLTGWQEVADDDD